MRKKLYPPVYAMTERKAGRCNANVVDVEANVTGVVQVLFRLVSVEHEGACRGAKRASSRA